MNGNSLLTRAIGFAAKQHEGQSRKGTDIPYIVHPLEAVAICATMTVDADVTLAVAESRAVKSLKGDGTLSGAPFLRRLWRTQFAATTFAKFSYLLLYNIPIFFNNKIFLIFFQFFYCIIQLIWSIIIYI